MKITQNKALQMIFDLKYLFTLFDGKSFSMYALDKNEMADQKAFIAKLLDDYKLVCSMLESQIDPFDYDICQPFMQSNITKCISKSNVGKKILSSF